MTLAGELFYLCFVRLLICIGFYNLQLVDNVLFSTLFLSLQRNIFTFFVNISIFRQKLYDNIVLRIFFSKKYFLQKIIILLHTSLFYFRYYCECLNEHISLNNLKLIMFAVSFISSRLHFVEYLILFCLVFVRLDFAVIKMLRFYKKYPEFLSKNFPNLIHKRHMWTQVTRSVVEAASNPQVQAAGALVAGALAWKGLDVYDTVKQEAIAEADRFAEDQRAEANRVAENQRAEADRVDENKRAEADRIAENQRAAFDKYTSAEYEQLSDKQKESIAHTINTGEIKL